MFYVYRYDFWTILGGVRCTIWMGFYLLTYLVCFIPIVFIWNRFYLFYLSCFQSKQENVYRPYKCNSKIYSSNSSASLIIENRTCVNVWLFECGKDFQQIANFFFYYWNYVSVIQIYHIRCSKCTTLTQGSSNSNQHDVSKIATRNYTIVKKSHTVTKLTINKHTYTHTNLLSIIIIFMH